MENYGKFFTFILPQQLAFFFLKEMPLEMWKHMEIKVRVFFWKIDNLKDYVSICVPSKGTVEKMSLLDFFFVTVIFRMNENYKALFCQQKS